MDSGVFTSIDIGSPASRHNRGVMLNRLRQAFNAGVKNSPNAKIRRAVDENTLSIDTSTGATTDRINLALFSSGTDQGFKRALYDAMVAGGDSGRLVGTDRKYAAAEYAQRRLAQYETEAYDAKIKKSQNDDSLSGLKTKSSLSAKGPSDTAKTTDDKKEGATSPDADPTSDTSPKTPPTETPTVTQPTVTPPTEMPPVTPPTETPVIEDVVERFRNVATHGKGQRGNDKQKAPIIEQLRERLLNRNYLGLSNDDTLTDTASTQITSTHPRGTVDSALVSVPLIYFGGDSTGSDGDTIAAEDVIYAIDVPQWLADDEGFKKIIRDARKDLKRLPYGSPKDGRQKIASDRLSAAEEAGKPHVNPPLFNTYYDPSKYEVMPYNRLNFGRTVIRHREFPYTMHAVDTVVSGYKDPGPSDLIRYWLSKINGYKIDQDYKDGVMNELSDDDFLFGLPAKEVLPHVNDRKARRALIEEPARKRRAEAWAAEQKAWEAEDAKASSNNSPTTK